MTTTRNAGHCLLLSACTIVKGKLFSLYNIPKGKKGEPWDVSLTDWSNLQIGATTMVDKARGIAYEQGMRVYCSAKNGADVSLLWPITQDDTRSHCGKGGIRVCPMVLSSPNTPPLTKRPRIDRCSLYPVLTVFAKHHQVRVAKLFIQNMTYSSLSRTQHFPNIRAHEGALRDVLECLQA
jgi:hypothetical protein